MPVGHPVLQWQDQSQLVLQLLLLLYLLITNFQAEKYKTIAVFKSNNKGDNLCSIYQSTNTMPSL